MLSNQGKTYWCGDCGFPWPFLLSTSHDSLLSLMAGILRHSCLLNLLWAGKAGFRSLLWTHSLVFLLGAVEAPGFHSEGAILGSHAGNLRENGLRRWGHGLAWWKEVGKLLSIFHVLLETAARLEVLWVEKMIRDTIGNWGELEMAELQLALPCIASILCIRTVVGALHTVTLLVCDMGDGILILKMMKWVSD